MSANKYGSREDTFVAPDLHNLVLAILPPADLSLVTTGLAPAFFMDQKDTRYHMAFSTQEKPRIKGLGLFCNLADGLTDGSANHGVLTGWTLLLRLMRFGAQMSGTISNTAGNAAIVGVATVFTRECAVGQTLAWYDENAVLRTGIILTITDDTNIVLTAVTLAAGMFTGATTANVCFPVIVTVTGVDITIPFSTLNQIFPYDFFLGDVSLVKQPGGRITVTAGSATVTGIGTRFQTDLQIDQAIGWTDDLGIRRTGFVLAIASDVSLTLAAVAVAGATATGVAMLFLDDHLRIFVQPNPVNGLQFTTISLDPLYQGKPFSISAVAVIEHSEDVDGLAVEV